MADEHSPSEADLNRANARCERARIIEGLRRESGFANSTVGEIATFVDEGRHLGTMCPKCGGALIPHDQLAAHVASHV